MPTENSGHTGISSFFFAHIFQVIPDILTGKFFFLTRRKKSFKELVAMKGPVEPVHRSVPETIQEVIELTGFLCFLFRSTPTLKAAACQAWMEPDNLMSPSSPETLPLALQHVVDIKVVL